MTRGDLAVVEEWLSAVGARDGARLLTLTTAEVELVGPRGRGRWLPPGCRGTTR